MRAEAREGSPAREVVLDAVSEIRLRIGSMASMPENGNLVYQLVFESLTHEVLAV